MADEFVDFYEALNLPLEADTKDVRKRINEVYLEAQRNLDHRNFQTRVKYQEMFEVLLPRARYILLDEGRRSEYDHLVRSFRGATAPVTPPPPTPAPITHEQAFGKGDTSSFRLAEVEEEPAGKAPPVERVPKPNLNPEQMAAQRDEMWEKWKHGLESAIVVEEDNEPKPQPARSAPTLPETPVASTQSGATTSPAQRPDPEAQRRPRQQASAISFNFNENFAHTPNPDDDEDTVKAKIAELERQKTERKRVVMREILDSVSLKGMIIGSLAAAVPLGALLIFLMGRYYPREGGPQLPLPSTVAWFIGIAIVLGGAFVAATQLAKSMRHQATLQLSMLPLEELLRRVGRTY